MSEPRFEADIDIDSRMAAMGFTVTREGDETFYEVPAGHPAEDVINKANEDFKAGRGVTGLTRPVRRPLR